MRNASPYKLYIYLVQIFAKRSDPVHGTLNAIDNQITLPFKFLHHFLKCVSPVSLPFHLLDCCCNSKHKIKYIVLTPFNKIGL